MDKFKDYRKACKYVMELRYPPIVQSFDRRGRILEVIHSQFKSKIEHWRVQNVQVHMYDNETNPLKQIVISHKQCSIIYNNPVTQQEFIDDANNFLRKFYSVFPEMNMVSRLGFRTISAFSAKEKMDFVDVYAKVSKQLLNNLIPSTLDFIDFRVQLNHSNGIIQIGPFKKEEEWVSFNFGEVGDDFPENGYAIDIDSFDTGIEIKADSDLIRAFSILREITFNCENEFMKDLI